MGPHVPDLIALEIFVAVGEEGSLSRAARRLGMSQQAVSARMRSMEAMIGSELLIRSARGSELSPAGRLVSGWAADVLAGVERLDAGIASLRSQTARQLDVAASPSPSPSTCCHGGLWPSAPARKQQDIPRLRSG